MVLELDEGENLFFTQRYQICFDSSWCAWVFLGFWVFFFCFVFLNLVILGGALFYLAVREILRNLNSGVFLVCLFLFKFQ